MCSVALKPLDWFLTDKHVKKGLEWISAEYCEKEKIYKGIPSVCKGAINMMAESVLPSVE